MLAKADASGGRGTRRRAGCQERRTQAALQQSCRRCGSALKRGSTRLDGQFAWRCGAQRLDDLLRLCLVCIELTVILFVFHRRGEREPVAHPAQQGHFRHGGAGLPWCGERCLSCARSACAAGHVPLGLSPSLKAPIPAVSRGAVVGPARKALRIKTASKPDHRRVKPKPKGGPSVRLRRALAIAGNALHLSTPSSPPSLSLVSRLSLPSRLCGLLSLFHIVSANTRLGSTTGARQYIRPRTRCVCKCGVSCVFVFVGVSGLAVFAPLLRPTRIHPALRPRPAPLPSSPPASPLPLKSACRPMSTSKGRAPPTPRPTAPTAVWLPLARPPAPHSIISLDHLVREDHLLRVGALRAWPVAGRRAERHRRRLRPEGR